MVDAQRICIVIVVFWICCSSRSTAEDTPKKPWEIEKERYAKFLEEIALEGTDYFTNENLVKIARAYNSVGNNPAALAAIDSVSEEWLNENGQLMSKWIYLHNVGFHAEINDPWGMQSFTRRPKQDKLRFVNRCLENGYKDRGFWLAQKAHHLYQASISNVADHRVRKPYYYTHDRKMYDKSFETLKLAFDVDPNFMIDPMLRLTSLHFPAMEVEPRFKQLMQENSKRLRVAGWEIPEGSAR